MATQGESSGHRTWSSSLVMWHITIPLLRQRSSHIRVDKIGSLYKLCPVLGISDKCLLQYIRLHYLTHSDTADTQDHRSIGGADGFLLLFGRHFIS